MIFFKICKIFGRIGKQEQYILAIKCSIYFELYPNDLSSEKFHFFTLPNFLIDYFGASALKIHTRGSVRTKITKTPTDSTFLFNNEVLVTIFQLSYKPERSYTLHFTHIVFECHSDSLYLFQALYFDLDLHGPHYLYAKVSSRPDDK